MRSVAGCRAEAGDRGALNSLHIQATLGQSCIHIAEQAPGEFTGWSDDIL